MGRIGAARRANRSLVRSRLGDCRSFSLFTSLTGVTDCPLPPACGGICERTYKDPETLKATASGGPQISGRAAMITFFLN